MGFLRVCVYGTLLTGTFVALHFAEPEMYAPVRKHLLYEDFVTPVMSEMHALAKPLIEEALRNPMMASWLGLPVEGDVADGSTPQKARKVGSDDRNATSSYGKNFSMPSQMGFSLVHLGEKINKRSVLSTEGNDSTYFEMPDGSQLWLQYDSVVEVGWSNKEAPDSELLLRVERGMMHIERPGDATGKVYLVTNSGIRYSLAPSDGWMATSQMGIVDKESFPDAESRMSGRYLDYVRQATLAEARELSKLLKSDGRREAMLYQDQLRLAAEGEDRRRQSLEESDLMPFEVVSIPLEIPSRRGGKDLARELGRMPASIALVKPLKFPGRAPASVSTLDEGTRIASEAKILKWTDKGQCSEAKKFFQKLREEHSLGDGDSWSLRMQQNFSQRCP